VEGLAAGLERLLSAVAEATDAPGSPATAAAVTRDRVSQAIRRRPRTQVVRRALAEPEGRAALLGWLLGGSLGGRGVAGERFERLAFSGPLAAALRPAVGDDMAAWTAAERAGRFLSGDGDRAPDKLRLGLEAWLARPAAARRSRR
jgi:hypothetical protein